jgi:putative nucleotidyltransferase with HDIG domain
MASPSHARKLHAVPDPTPSSAHERGQHRGHGQRLIEAIEAVDRFPMLGDARKRVLSTAGAGRATTDALVGAAESDVALALAVLRTVNLGKRPKDAVGSLRKAVEALGPPRVVELARKLPSADFFQPATSFRTRVDSVRLHAVAVKRMTTRLALLLERSDHDDLVAVALLHDVGKLVLCHAVPEYPDKLVHAAKTPDQRVRAERLALGFDHATVGALVARRAGLPPGIAGAIETHHRADGIGMGAIVRLADMLVHYAGAQAVDANSMLAAAGDLGLHPAALRELMYELPNAGRGPATVRPSPLTPSELSVMRKLAEGKLYKQIAEELGRSSSTVRTHLHHIYRKLEVYDRAQAVLLAVEQGWV